MLVERPGRAGVMIYTETDRRYYPPNLLTLKQIHNSTRSVEIIFQAQMLSPDRFNSAYDLHLARKEELGLYFSRD